MSIHEEWLKKVKLYAEVIKSEYELNLKLPPATLDELKLEYLEVSPGDKMQAKLPFQDRFTNPVGLYQGGFLVAAMDEVFGPLSYVTADRPCMTLSLNTTFLRPFTREMKHCFIQANVLQKTRTFIFMRAEVRSPQGDLLAHAESHVTIMRDDQLQKEQP